MSDTRTVKTSTGGELRVYQKGEGRPLGFLAGLGGLPRWRPFLDELARSRQVIAPCLPGFPGGPPHDELDEQIDWTIATLDLLEAAGLGRGSDLVGESLGATLALEAAAVWGDDDARLALVSPLGIFDEQEPVTDVWAIRPREQGALLCSEPDAYTEWISDAGDADAFEWQIESIRGWESAARLLWPLCDTRVVRRLHRVRRPTLLVWGSDDRVVPASHAKRYEQGIAGPVTLRSLEGAGHLADLDRPAELAALVLEFLESR